MLHTAIEAVDQYQRQLVLALRQGRGDDKVALAGCGADVHHTLVVESRTQHAHVDTSAKGVIVVFQLLQHGAGATFVQGIQVGDDSGDAAIQVRAVGAQGLQVLLHVGIHLAAVQAQRGISVHQQVHVEDEVLVTCPQVAHLAKEAHALLHLDSVDGTQRGSCHHYRGGRCTAQHLTVPHQDIPILEQVKVIDLVAAQEQVERLAVEAVLRVGLQLLEAFLAVPADDAQVVLVVLVVKEQLCHVQGVGHQALVHAGTAQPLVGQLLEGVFDQVELSQRAGNGGARVLAQSAVGVLDARDVVITVRGMPDPVLLAALAHIVVIG